MATMPSSSGEWVPNTDIYETESALVIRMEVSSVSREDIQIQLDDRMLVVTGRRIDPCRVRKCRFYQMEIHYGAFERRLPLPRTVDCSRTKASYQNGFLILEIPKATQTEHVSVRIPVHFDSK